METIVSEAAVYTDGVLIPDNSRLEALEMSEIQEICNFSCKILIHHILYHYAPHQFVQIKIYNHLFFSDNNNLIFTI